MREKILIRVGQQVQVNRDAFYWLWDGKEITIPIGTIGKIVRWHPGCAIRFKDITHPKFFDFPMSCTKPGEHELPDCFTLLQMEEETHAL